MSPLKGLKIYLPDHPRLTAWAKEFRPAGRGWILATRSAWFSAYKALCGFSKAVPLPQQILNDANIRILFTRVDELFDGPMT